MLMQKSPDHGLRGPFNVCLSLESMHRVRVLVVHAPCACPRSPCTRCRRRTVGCAASCSTGGAVPLGRYPEAPVWCLCHWGEVQWRHNSPYCLQHGKPSRPVVNSYPPYRALASPGPKSGVARSREARRDRKGRRGFECRVQSVPLWWCRPPLLHQS